ncbi:MAG: nitroreductase family protein [Nitrospirae bacterium]|nr:nitroreductase family protein [Nitrospirota bacterium]MBI5696149.1 nitroreductase family protein [Nitrospirota bacterium]
MTEFGDVLAGRRSVRRFRPEPVPRDVLMKILAAGSWAPSPTNRQGWEFAAVYSDSLKKEMADAARGAWDDACAKAGGISGTVSEYAGNFVWFADAPVVIVVSARRPEGFMQSLFGGDAGTVSGSGTAAAMAAQNIMLAAHAEGIGTCCLTGPLAAGDRLKKIAGVGGRFEIVCLVALGYPAETPAAPERKPVDDYTRIIDDER